MIIDEISYHKAMEMMEEFRLIMKRFHKKSDAPYRKPEFQAMLFLSCKEKITMQELGEELHVTKPRVTALVSELLEKDFDILLSRVNEIFREELSDKEENNETN